MKIILTLFCFLFGEKTADNTTMLSLDYYKKSFPKRDLKGFAEWLKWHQANNNIFIKVKNI